MGFKVLIAEDDRHTRTILEHIFTKDPAFKEMDIELLLASDGEQALRQFKSHNPDLIISDLLMPKMDGFAFCRAVRESPQGKDKPLVITSAIYKETALLNRLREELQVTFFPKPFQVREFTNEILHLINRPSQSEQIEFTRDRITMSGPFKGGLADKSLPAILLDIQKIEGTGVLTLERGKMKKEIFFQFGRPIGADSNIRHENLGNYLVNKKIITESLHQNLLLEAKDKRVSFLKALLDLRQFDDELVLKYHSSLVKVRIVNAFRWHEGTYAFLPGDSFSDRITKAPVDPVALVFAGLKRISDLDEITARLEDNILSVIEVTSQGKNLHKEFVRIFGDEVANHIESGVTTIGELLGKGIDPISVYTHMYIMSETLMITFHKGEAGANTTAYKQMVEDPLNLSNLKKAATVSREPEEEISIVVNVPPPPSNALDGGLILDLPMEVETDDGTDLVKMVKDFYLEVHEKDYFELLEVREDSPAHLIESAYADLVSRFNVDNFTSVDLGAEHFKLEEITEFLKIARRTLLDPQLKQEYLEKRDIMRQKGETSLDAEVLARRGQEHLKLGNTKDALNLLESAVKLKPDIGDYHAFYAKALLAAGADAGRYLTSLQSAIDLAPDAISVNLLAGEIHHQTGREEEAVSFYEKVLELQPEHDEAFEALESIYQARGAWRVLERLHRKIIHLCGNRRPMRTIALAKSLANLYEVHLKDFDKAKAAWEIVLSVMPHDGDAQLAMDRVKQQLQSVSMSPKETIDNVREQIARAPLNTALYESGFNVSREFHPDLAFLFASAMISLGSTNEEAAEFVRRYSPPFLARAWRQIDGDVWRFISDPNDLDSVGKIFEVVCLSIPEASIFPLQECAANPLPEAEIPPPWYDVLTYLSHQLSVPFPPVCFSKHLPQPMLIAKANQFMLGIPVTMAQTEDKHLIAAAATRLAASYWTGRALPLVVQPDKLLLLLKAVLALISSKGADDAQVLTLRQKLEAGGPVLREMLSKLFAEISAQHGNINVTQWSRGVHRSLNNLSFILSQNLPLVYGALEPDEQAALLAYAVSENALTVRKMLGLSIEV